MSTEKRFESDSGSRINNEDDYDTSFEMNSFDELEDFWAAVCREERVYKSKFQHLILD